MELDTILKCIKFKEEHNKRKVKDIWGRRYKGGHSSIKPLIVYHYNTMSEADCIAFREPFVPEE